MRDQELKPRIYRYVREAEALYDHPRSNLKRLDRDEFIEMYVLNRLKHNHLDEDEKERRRR